MRFVAWRLGILLVLSYTSVMAQFDTNYVHINKNKFLISPIFEFYRTDIKLFIEDTDTSKSNTEEIEYRYKTRNSLYLGFSLSFNRFGVSLSFKLPYSNIPHLRNSKSLAFTGGYSYNKLYGEFRWKHYKGIQKDEIKIINDSTVVSSMVLDDIETKQIGGTLYWFASNKYNFDGNFKNFNTQIKSAHSPVLNIALNYYGIGGSITTTEHPDSSVEFINQHVDVYSAKSSGGWAASIVYHQFYVSGFALLGVAYHHHIYQNQTVLDQFAPDLEFRGVTGYNSRNFFSTFTFSYTNDVIYISQKQSSIRHFMFNVKLGIKINSKYLGKAKNIL